MDTTKNPSKNSTTPIQQQKLKKHETNHNKQIKTIHSNHQTTHTTHSTSHSTNFTSPNNSTIQ